MSDESNVEFEPPDLATVRNDRILALDGLRGLAILTVMIFHFAEIPMLTTGGWFDDRLLETVRMGWIGVELFFALSGFLITGILLKTRLRPNYFRNFYMRRSLRIFPVYYFYLLLTIAALSGAAIVGRLPISTYAAFVKGVPYLLTYTSNLYSTFTGSYTNLSTGHFWSLAVEEQFYLCWPMLVYRLESNRLFKIVVSLLVTALAARWLMAVAGFDNVSIYVFPFAQMDSLLIGALGALIVHMGSTEVWRPQIIAVFFSTGVVSIMLLEIFGPTADNRIIHVYGLTVLMLFFGSGVFLSSTSTNPPRWLVNRPLEFLGKYSYGLYVFHPIIRAVLLEIYPRPVLFAGSVLPWLAIFELTAFAVSIAIAVTSFNFFESKFLAMKGRLG